MSSQVPESREVWEHGEREFDRRDAALGRPATAVGAVAGAVAIVLLAHLFVL